MPTWFVWCESPSLPLRRASYPSPIRRKIHPTDRRPPFHPTPTQPPLPPPPRPESEPPRFPRDPNHLSLHGTQIIVATCPSIIRGLNHSSACEILAPTNEPTLLRKGWFRKGALHPHPLVDLSGEGAKQQVLLHYGSLFFSFSISLFLPFSLFLSLSLSLSLSFSFSLFLLLLLCSSAKTKGC